MDFLHISAACSVYLCGSFLCVDFTQQTVWLPFFFNNMLVLTLKWLPGLGYQSPPISSLSKPFWILHASFQGPYSAGLLFYLPLSLPSLSSGDSVCPWTEPQMSASRISRVTQYAQGKCVCFLLVHRLLKVQNLRLQKCLSGNALQ